MHMPRDVGPVHEAPVQAQAFPPVRGTLHLPYLLHIFNQVASHRKSKEITMSHLVTVLTGRIPLPAHAKPFPVSGLNRLCMLICRHKMV
jgi:hypothetical protein